MQNESEKKFELKFIEDVENVGGELISEAQKIMDELNEEDPNYFKDIQETLKNLPKEDVKVTTHYY